MATVLDDTPDIATPEESVIKLRQMVASNPLRLWRTGARVSLNEVSTLLGRSLSIIQRWEQGAVFPREHDWPKLATLTGDKDIEQKWGQWWKSRPSL